MKKCKVCNLLLEESKFSVNNAKKDKLQTYCRECRKTKQKYFYTKNSNYYKLKSKLQKQQIKDWFKGYKKTLTCSRCPENNPVCLQFHHLDKGKKDFNISNAVSEKVSIDKIKQEIEKCVVLCANCHLKEHFSEFYQFPY